MKPGDRQYGAGEKESALAILDQEGGNFQKASRIVKVSAMTLKRWNDARSPDKVEKARLVERENFIKQAWETISQCVEELKKKVPDASAKELAVIIGILFDKVAKIETASAGLTIEQIERLEIKGLSDSDLEYLIQKRQTDLAIKASD